MESDAARRDRSVGFVVAVFNDEGGEVLVRDVELDEVEEDPKDDWENAGKRRLGGIGKSENCLKNETGVSERFDSDIDYRQLGLG